MSQSRVFFAGLLILSSSVLAAPEISDPLTSLKDPDPAVRRAAIDQVVYQDMRRGLRPLRAELADSNVLVRESAAWALGQMRDASAASLLAARWKEEKSLLVKSAIVEAMGKIRSEEESPAVLEQAFRARSPILSRPAAIGLGLFCEWAKARVLLDRVKDSSPRVREAIALALAPYKEAESKAALEDLAMDPIATVKDRAVFSLKLQEEGEGFFGAAAQGLKSPDSSVRRISARLLGLRGALKESRAPLVELDRRDLEPGVRLEARLALAQIGRREKELERAAAEKANARAKARKKRKRRPHPQNVPSN